MLAGVALTPLAILLLVERGARSLALLSIVFTAIEVAGAISLLLLLGPKGLAWSCAITVWIGVYLIFYMLQAESGKFTLITLRSLFQRPSLYISIGSVSILLISFTMGALTYFKDFKSLLVMMFLIIILSYSMEPQIQSFFKKK
jgi:peptidoglycan biosynthesis protein MviN/MurJ (putative lipid II flippase)